MRIMVISRRVLAAAHAVALTAVVAGCALTPAPTGDELRKQALPHTEVPTTFKAAGGVPAPVVDRWLATFDDPALPPLVAEALFKVEQLGADLLQHQLVGGENGAQPVDGLEEFLVLIDDLLPHEPG